MKYDNEKRISLFINGTLTLDGVEYSVKQKELLNETNEAIEQFRIDLEKVKENPFITEKELEK